MRVCDWGLDIQAQPQNWMQAVAYHTHCILHTSQSAHTLPSIYPKIGKDCKEDLFFVLIVYDYTIIRLEGRIEVRKTDSCTSLGCRRGSLTTTKGTERVKEEKMCTSVFSFSVSNAGLD